MRPPRDRSFIYLLKELSRVQNQSFAGIQTHRSDGRSAAGIHVQDDIHSPTSGATKWCASPGSPSAYILVTPSSSVISGCGLSLTALLPDSQIGGQSASLGDRLTVVPGILQPLGRLTARPTPASRSRQAAMDERYPVALIKFWFNQKLFQASPTRACPPSGRFPNRPNPLRDQKSVHARIVESCFQPWRRR